MNLALILLRTGEYLISETEQLEYEPKVHLSDPYKVSGKTKLTLSRWPEYTEDKHVLLHSDCLLTVCEPTEAVVSAYLKKTGKTLDELTTAPEPVILNEDIQEQPLIHEGIDEDEYEPRYVEEGLY